MMQTILKAIANGNLRMGTETTTHTPKFRRAILNRASSMDFV